MKAVKLTFTKEYIDHCILEDRDLYVFTSDGPFTPAEVTLSPWVGGWSIRLIGVSGKQRVVATPTNRRTGNILRIGKINALQKQFPHVDLVYIEQYVRVSKGFPYVWDQDVQTSYFHRLLKEVGCKTPILTVKKAQIVHTLLNL